MPGNPNVLTRDIGTSGLAQGSTAMTCRVRIAAWTAPLPEVEVYRLPPGVAAGGTDPT